MAPLSRTNVPLVMALWASGLGAAAQFAKISVLFDFLAARYPDVGPGIGFLVSLVGVIGLIFGTTASLLVQRIGYRTVVVGALLTGAAVSAFQAQLPDFGWMIASRVVEGASHLGLVVAGPVLMAQNTAPRHQGMVMTLWASFFGVSFALMAWLGLPLARAFGPGAVFLAHAGCMSGLAVTLFALLPADQRPSDQRPFSLAEVARLHATTYTSPFIAAPAFGFVFYAMIYVAILTLLPPMMPAAWRGVVATGMPLFSIAVSMILGVQLLRRMPAVRLVQFGLALAGLCTAALYLFWTSSAVIPIAFILSGALGLVQGGSFAAIPQLNRTATGQMEASGAVAQLGNLGTTLGTPALAAFIATFGISGIPLLCVPLCICGVLVHSRLAARRAG